MEARQSGRALAILARARTLHESSRLGQTCRRRVAANECEEIPDHRAAQLVISDRRVERVA
jgi:hypothetical protein